MQWWKKCSDPLLKEKHQNINEVLYPEMTVEMFYQKNVLKVSKIPTVYATVAFIKSKTLVTFSKPMLCFVSLDTVVRL